MIPVPRVRFSVANRRISDHLHVLFLRFSEAQIHSICCRQWKAVLTGICYERVQILGQVYGKCYDACLIIGINFRGTRFAS
jgi:hypothetical protein